jgi:glyceraldehyde-3-phosphate dehydrogenase/erythrose-4-phosphate dehydrogenase
MTIKVGINGFGRIGRMVFRAAVQNFSDIEIVGINDLLEPDYLAYMLKYDSVHGRFKGEVSVDGNTLVVNGKRIRLTAERDPSTLKWNEVGAEVVIESTGREKGGHVRPVQRRHPHVRLRRERQNLRWPGHHFQRFLHHQLFGTGGQSVE